MKKKKKKRKGYLSPFIIPETPLHTCLAFHERRLHSQNNNNNNKKKKTNKERKKERRLVPSE
jgi:hypothetical protein